MKYEISKRGIYQYVPVYNCTNQYILVCTSISIFEYVHTGTYMVCMWNGSLTCSGAPCVPGVIPLTWLSGAFIPSTPRFVANLHTFVISVHTITYCVCYSTYQYIPLHTTHTPFFGSRIPLLSSHRILTASRRTATVYPWKTVGMPVQSSSLPVICAHHMDVCQKTLPTKKALMIFATPWFSSVPLKCLICPSKGRWKMLEWSSCMNHPLHPVCTWLLHRTWLAESP